jgi:hypothetical protein
LDLTVPETSQTIAGGSVPAVGRESSPGRPHTPTNIMVAHDKIRHSKSAQKITARLPERPDDAKDFPVMCQRCVRDMIHLGEEFSPLGLVECWAANNSKSGACGNCKAKGGKECVLVSFSSFPGSFLANYR